MSKEMILLLNSGNPNYQSLASMVRKQNVYADVRGGNIPLEELKALAPKGLILTGETPPDNLDAILDMGIPILSIGSLSASVLGEKNAVAQTEKRESTLTLRKKDSALFKGFSEADDSTFIETSHFLVSDMPSGMDAVAVSGNNLLIFENADKKFFGLFIHPELRSTSVGEKVIKNFLFEVCGVEANWTMEQFAEQEIKNIRDKVGDGKVLLALSGGVDSSVVAALLERAIGSQLTCIFVNHGFMRKHEPQEVETAFSNTSMNFLHIDAEARFLQKVKGITDPEEKRKLIGEEFIRVFEEEAKKIGAVDFLAQGTIYPDIVESGIGIHKAVKSHHNVGGLPDHVDFKEIIEPVKYLFKDEVRSLGHILGLPDEIVERQPFPGPGLAIRCIGELTKERLDVLRDADLIFREEIKNAGLNHDINQYFAVLTSVRSVGVTEDARTYQYTLALRAVLTEDFMSASFARIPYETLAHISNRITTEVSDINRIVYDITNKPPSTIEWE